MEEGEGEGLLVLVFGVGWFGWMDYSACACMMGEWGVHFVINSNGKGGPKR